MLSAAPRSLSAPHTIGSACHFDKKKLLFLTASIVIIIIKILMRPCIQLGQQKLIFRSSPILNAHRQNNDEAPHILGHLDDADGKDNDDDDI